MALTLAEAAKLSTDVLRAGVIEEVIQESPILQRLPFVELVGNAWTYNREEDLPGVDWHAVGGTWDESTPTFSRHTATLRILGGDADVDNYLRTTRANVNDLEAAVIALKAKALRREFERAFIDGDEDDDPNQFDGIDTVLGNTPGPHVLTMGTNGGTLTLDKMDELVDSVRGTRPDMLLLSRRSRRKLSSLRRATGNLLETDRNQFGQRALFYDGIELGVCDDIADDRTVGTSTDCSTIYALTFGEDGVLGLSAPGLIEVERIGALATQDASRTRVKWYCGWALLSTSKLSKLIGVRD